MVMVYSYVVSIIVYYSAVVCAYLCDDYQINMLGGYDDIYISVGLKSIHMKVRRF